MPESSADYAAQVAHTAAGREKARSLEPLRRLVPFLKPYRTRIAIAGVALVSSSAASLVIPVAVRRMIDHGFDERYAAQIGHYFLALIGIAAILGIATATRFYFVTWLGERVIADIRKAVFNHVLSLTPAFFEITRTGEVLSRLTADTTLIQTVIGSSASVAMRNAVMLTGGLILLFLTSLKLSVMVLAAVVLVMVPLIGFGRWVRALSRKSQDRVADTSARAGETLNAVQTVQAFTHESEDRKLFGQSVEGSFDVAITRTRARAAMTAVTIFAMFSCIVGVLWVGARDVIAHTMTSGELTQFILYAGIVASGFGALSETWGDLQRAAGASERLMELLHVEPDVKTPANPRV
ncbi:MAG TPA: ABC transporter transmembrane domain-containing protein, partial [Rhizomicrobium sp.]